MISKIFIGYPVQTDLKNQLNQSADWNKSKIFRKENSDELLEVRYQDKNYIGRFLIQEMLTLTDLEVIARDIENRLKNHCPGYPLEKLAIRVFSQVFIS